MIECSGCQTLNPEGEAACLACGAPLPRAAAGGATAAGATRCPNGHPIDPSWKSCPYCERTQLGGAGERLDDATRPLATRLEPPDAAGSAGGRRTRLEGEAAWPEPAPRGPVPTRLEPPEPAAGRRTVLQQDGPAPAAPQGASSPAAAPGPAASAPPASGGKLVGVLAAPGLGPSGAVFAVRAGKNVVGADRTCDVVIAGDAQVSREHAVLLCRGGTFQLADRLSTNGTWVNGQEVPPNGALSLRDRDRIRVGGTELLFFVVEQPESPPAAGAGPESA